MSSVFSERPFLGALEYCSMKAALDMLTKVMALELGSNNIRVVGVRPTLVVTDMQKQVFSQEEIPGLVDMFKAKSPLRKIAEIEDVVNTVVFLLSDKASLITGSSVDVDAGYLVG
jgi:NAD(P)-dependent dehydrogenase (short-subunit alcohol dehydrogenase family)